MQHLDQGQLRVTDRLDRATHVLCRLDDGWVHRRRGRRPESKLDGLGLLEDARPDVLSEVGRDGSDEERSGANPVEDEVAGHPDVAGDLAVPVACSLKLVKAELEGVLVVSAAKSSVNGRIVWMQGGDSRLVMTLGNVDEVVNLIFEDGIVVVTGTSPEVRLVFDQILNNPSASDNIKGSLPLTSHHPSKVCTRRIFAFAVFSSKFASSNPSPASAKLNLVASAPNFSIASLSVNELPVLFDIFFPFSIKCPFVLIASGHLSSGKSAAWL